MMPPSSPHVGVAAHMVRLLMLVGTLLTARVDAGHRPPTPQTAVWLENDLASPTYVNPFDRADSHMLMTPVYRRDYNHLTGERQTVYLFGDSQVGNLKVFQSFSIFDRSQYDVENYALSAMSIKGLTLLVDPHRDMTALAAAMGDNMFTSLYDISTVLPPNMGFTRPSVVCLSVGLRDVIDHKWSTNPTVIAHLVDVEYRALLHAVARAVGDSPTTIMVTSILPMAHTVVTYMNGNIIAGARAVNTALEALVREFRDTYTATNPRVLHRWLYVNVFDAMLTTPLQPSYTSGGAYVGGTLNPSLFFEEQKLLMHPNGAGYVAWAAAIAQTLEGGNSVGGGGGGGSGGSGNGNGSGGGGGSGSGDTTVTVAVQYGGSAVSLARHGAAAFSVWAISGGDGLGAGERVWLGADTVSSIGRDTSFSYTVTPTTAHASRSIEVSFDNDVTTDYSADADRDLIVSSVLWTSPTTTTTMFSPSMPPPTWQYLVTWYDGHVAGTVPGRLYWGGVVRLQLPASTTPTPTPSPIPAVPGGGATATMVTVRARSVGVGLSGEGAHVVVLVNGQRVFDFYATPTVADYVLVVPATVMNGSGGGGGVTEVRLRYDNDVTVDYNGDDERDLEITSVTLSSTTTTSMLATAPTVTYELIWGQVVSGMSLLLWQGDLVFDFAGTSSSSLSQRR